MTTKGYRQNKGYLKREETVSLYLRNMGHSLKGLSAFQNKKVNRGSTNFQREEVSKMSPGGSIYHIAGNALESPQVTEP